jgi:hypothetical protein
MINFSQYLTEAISTEGKVKHIHHPEDRPIINGSKGFEHAMGALHQAHEHIKSGKKNSGLTMKYDGSPALVFGHHPKTGKFFVATKSAFNANPKINHTPEDIERNHGDKPELANKLNQALEHLPKVTPKKGVYQGDMMYTHNDVVHNQNGSASFTPNTITYSAHGTEANKIKKSKMGVIVHQQYHGNKLEDMKASPEITDKLRQHPDVWHKPAEHDTSMINHGPMNEIQFKKHMEAAQKAHTEGGKEMYTATEPHQGAGGHMATYINQTVRNNAKPTTSGLQQHIMDKSQIVQSKLKTAAKAQEKQRDAQKEVNYIHKNRQHYDNFFKMHQHLQKAKNVLVHTLNQHPGTLSHHIDGKETHPEGFVVNHKNEPSKLIDRAEFSRANLMKVRKPNANV